MASAPTTPDWTSIANQQSQATRYNQFTPFGSSIWNGNTQYNTLSPNQQGILGQQEQFSQGVGQRINSALPNINLNGVDTSQLPQAPINPGQTAQDAIMGRLEPLLNRQRTGMQTQLANQGIPMGSEAWQNAHTDQNSRESDLYSQAALQGINAGQNAINSGIQNQIAIQNQPINAVNALRNGMNLNVPQFSNTGQAPDLMGAAQNTYTANMGLYNTQTASNNNALNGLFGLGSAALSAYPWK